MCLSFLLCFLFVAVDDVQIREALPDVFACKRQQKMAVGRQNLLSSPRATGMQGDCLMF